MDELASGEEAFGPSWRRNGVLGGTAEEEVEKR
jgi:hypothetical protein